MLVNNLWWCSHCFLLITFSDTIHSFIAQRDWGTSNIMLGFEKKIRIFLTIKETANQATAWWLTLKLSPNKSVSHAGQSWRLWPSLEQLRLQDRYHQVRTPAFILQKVLSSQHLILMSQNNLPKSVQLLLWYFVIHLRLPIWRGWAEHTSYICDAQVFCCLPLTTRKRKRNLHRITEESGRGRRQTGRGRRSKTAEDVSLWQEEMLSASARCCYGRALGSLSCFF